MEALKLYWLGPPRIELRGRSVKLETRKSAGLLAYLSLARGESQREMLAAMFWPEANQRTASANLRRTLSSLNSRLPGWIQADRGTIALKTGRELWLDVGLFHQLLSRPQHCRSENEVCDECLSSLAAAVACCRGEFLEGLHLDDCPNFDEWEFFQRDSLGRQLGEALQRLARGYADRQQWDEAIACARRWLALDRLHEPACRALMDLYAQSGQKNAALRQYDELAQLLKEQGQEPEAETCRLWQQLRGGEARTPELRTSPGPSSFPLLKTKLFVPTAPAPRVTRSHLIDCLEQVGSRAFTLISAPAGFGKTTLLAEWMAESSLDVAWLSLDGGDNDPFRFLSYLAAALEGLAEGVGAEAQQLMRSSQLPPPHIILASLINDLGRIAEPFALVLDDYQFVTESLVHEAVAYLLDHLPAAMHLVIATRSDPPLQLGRLRAHDQLLELRTQDLRFTPEESAALLNGGMRLGLSATDLQALQARTEGWVVGLQMAGLSLRGHENASEFIRAFSGSHRYVLDYLVEEVLRRQPADIQTFLLETSTLDKLSGPLCDAVVSERARQPGRSGQAVLEYLERSNLFVVPLDDRRQWYRYHHLFADLLRARLGQVSPGVAPQLHERAAVWLEQAGMALEAINHALAAGAHEHAARLVEENTTRLFAQGELNALMSWIQALPAGLRRARPWLCVHQAYALAFAGQPNDLESLLSQAEAALDASSARNIPPSAGHPGETAAAAMERAEARALQGAVATVRAVAAVLMGQDDEAVSQALQARALLPPTDLFDAYLVAWVLGNSMLTTGRLPEARLALEEQIRLGRAMGDLMVLVVGLTYLAEALRGQGRLRQARARLEEALAAASQQGAASLGYIALLKTSLAGVLAEQNELEDARRLLTEAFGHTRQWPNPNYEAYVYAIRARVLRAQGDLEGARISIGEASRISSEAPLTRLLQRSVDTELLQTWLALQAAGVSLLPGDPMAERVVVLLAVWRRELPDGAMDDPALLAEGAEVAALNLARVSLAAGHADEALSLLERVVRSTRAAGHIERAIASLVLIAIAWNTNSAGPASGSAALAAALEALEEALSLAQPGGYARIFLDQGRPLRELLELSMSRGLPARLRDYVLDLLRASRPPVR